MNLPNVHIEKPAGTPEEILKQIIERINLTFGAFPVDAITALTRRSRSKAMMISSTDQQDWNDQIKDNYLWSIEADQEFIFDLSMIKVKSQRRVEELV